MTPAAQKVSTPAERGGWIPVDEQKPPVSPGPLRARETDWVWALDSYGGQYRAHRCIDGIGNEVYEIQAANHIQHVPAKHITHWQLLPPAPEEG